MGSVRGICVAAEMVKEGEEPPAEENLQMVSGAVSFARHHLDLTDPAIKIQTARPAGSVVFYDLVGKTSSSLKCLF